MKKVLYGCTAATLLVASVGLVGTAAAAYYNLVGQAQLVSPGAAGSNSAVSLLSDFNSSDPEQQISHIQFEVPDGLTFAQLAELSVEYNVTDDDCVPDSPRFQISIDIGGDGGDDGYIDVYVGEGADFTGCPANTWINSGNLIGNNDPDRYKYSGLTEFTFGDYDYMLNRFGDALVTGFVQLTVDNGWKFSDNEQEVLVDNVNINGEIFTFELSTPDEIASCKNGGWQELTREDRTPFKNQGSCIQYVAVGG
jgi:hypothetical protein